MLKNICLVIVFLLALSAAAQEKIVYKQIDTLQLTLEVYQPESIEEGERVPGMIFFFGGGWNGGSTHQFLRQAEYLSQKGIVCFLAEYRVKNRNNTSPFEALKDAKSAMRYLRAHAADFNVDPDKIIAAGGSAGGHLAAATALCNGYNDKRDDLSVSCIPNALVLFNAVVDNGPGGYGYERVGEAYKSFSPLHNIDRAAPPTLLLLGNKDHLIPVATYNYYKAVMDKLKRPCVLKIYEGGKHGFFNYNKKTPAFYNATLAETEQFLSSLGYLVLDE